MRLSTWLLTGSSITLLALAPLSVARAQDATNPALVEAYKAFAADQSDANKQALDAACQAAGFASLEDCVKALQSPPKSEAAPPAPSSEAAPAPSSEAAPAPSSEAAPPPPPPSSEAPPPPPPPSSEEPPKPKAKPIAKPSEAPSSSSEEQAAPAASSEQVAPPAPSSSEEPTPKPKPKPKKLPASSVEPAPASSVEPAAPLAVSSEAVPAPSSSEAAPAPSKQVAPPSSEQAPVAAPSNQEAAPSSAQPVAPSSEQPKNNGVARLKRAVDEYNQGVTDLSAGDKAGQAKIDDAKKKIDALCTAAGIPDVTACLAQFGLVLNPLPPQPGEPSSATPEVTAPTSSEAPPPQPSVPPVSELPKASEAVTPSAVEVLPSTVQPSEAAPLLDSQKDETKQSSSQEQSSSQQPPPPATPPAPPPKSDQQAQQDIKAPPPDQSLLTDKGKKIDVQQIQVQPPTDAPQPIKVIQFPNGGPHGGPNGNVGPNGKPPQNGNAGPAPQQPQNNGIIFQIGVNIVINNPEQERDRFYDPRQDQIYYEDLGRGRTRETIQRKDGSKIVTVRDRTGDILQRSKVLPNGRVIILATYDPRDQDIATWRDPGEDLPPLKLNIPADQYIMDADTSDDQQVYNFLAQPPVEQVRRIYTIDEVKRSARLRDSVRRLEVGDLTFDTGKATISRNQVGALQDVADAMNRLLQRNPGEVFLIEGHTDAVGSDVSNLVLSDQRAATVARILTDFYDIPPENLVTQGYGERYLKVQTDGPEPLNRRVTIKRITPLISYASNK